MVVAAVFQGTERETAELLKAVDTNCSCGRNAAGMVVLRCGAHEMLVNQHFIDHVLFLRRIVQRLAQKEWSQSQEVSKES